MVFTPPDIKGKVCTCIITDPAVAADTDIDLDEYDIKLDMDEPFPILSVDIIIFTPAGPAFTYEKFNVNDYGTSGSLGATEMCVEDEDTFRVGVALDTGATHYVIIVQYIGSRIKNT